MIGWRLINILAISTLISIAFESRGNTQGQRLVKAPQTDLMVGFFAAILMSHLVHTYFWGLQDSFSKFGTIFLLFFIILNSHNTAKKLKISIWLIVFMTLILVFDGIMQVKTGYGFAGQSILYQNNGSNNGIIERIRWIGIFGDPNDLALLFVMGVGFVLPFIFKKISFFYRMVNIAIVGFLCYGLYLTNSRGGILALMATIFYFFIRKTKKYVLGGIVGGGAALAILILGPSRMGSLSSGENSAATRLDLWYGGIQLFKSSPIFGVGYGMFADDLPLTAHNSYVLALSELGFVGLFLWVALIYISIKGLCSIQHKNNELYDYSLGIQSALIGFCAAAFFLSRTYIIIPYILFAFAGSAMFITNKTHKELIFNFTKKDATRVFLLSLGIIIAVVIMVRSR